MEDGRCDGGSGEKFQKLFVRMQELFYAEASTGETSLLMEALSISDRDGLEKLTMSEA